MTRASFVALAALAAAPVLAVDAAPAQADVIHVGGSASIRVGGGIRVRTPRVHWRPHRHYGPRAGAVIYVGGGGYYDYRWAAPPPPPPCDCAAPVPAYYYPAQPAAVVVAQPPAPRLARLGLGGFIGSTDNDSFSGEGEDAGIFLRLRLTRGLILEGEAAHSDLDGPLDETRVGASAIYEFGAKNRWAPYILLGGGVSATGDDDGDDDDHVARSYGEIGVGLRFAVTERFHLAGDIRGGAATTLERDERYYDDSPDARGVIIPPDDSEEETEYTRARLSAVIYF